MLWYFSFNCSSHLLFAPNHYPPHLSSPTLIPTGYQSESITSPIPAAAVSELTSFSNWKLFHCYIFLSVSVAVGVCSVCDREIQLCGRNIGMHTLPHQLASHGVTHLHTQTHRCLGVNCCITPSYNKVLVNNMFSCWRVYLSLVYRSLTEYV